MSEQSITILEVDDGFLTIKNPGPKQVEIVMEDRIIVLWPDNETTVAKHSVIEARIAKEDHESHT